MQENVTMYLLVMHGDRISKPGSQVSPHRDTVNSRYSITFSRYFFNRITPFYSVECFGLNRPMYMSLLLSSPINWDILYFKPVTLIAPKQWIFTTLLLSFSEMLRNCSM